MAPKLSLGTIFMTDDALRECRKALLPQGTLRTMLDGHASNHKAGKGVYTVTGRESTIKLACTTTTDRTMISLPKEVG